MKILITRPEPDAARLAAILRGLGHDAVSAPMMSIENLSGTKVDVDGVQALLVTSANGARALGRATAFRNVKIFAVGAATAEAVRTEGFDQVTSADGDVPSLAAKVIEMCKPEDGKLVHIAGTEVAGDLSGLLNVAGFNCERAVLYEAKPVKSLPSDVTKQIKAGSIDAALFYSPRTAAIVTGIVTAADLPPYMKSMTAFCLSSAVAEKIESLPWGGLQVAAEPNQENLLALLAAVSQAETSDDNPDKPREQKMSDKNSGKTEGQDKMAVPPSGPDAKKSEIKDAMVPEKPGKPKSHIGLILVLLVLVFCLGLAAWPFLYPKVERFLPPETAAIISGQFGKTENTDDTTAAIVAVKAALEADYAKLNDRLSKLEASEPAAAASGADDGKLTELSSGMTARISELETQLADQKEKVEAALGELEQQQGTITSLKEAKPIVADPSPEIQNQIIDLKNTLLDIKTQMSSLQGDLATERDTVKSQATQLSSLEGALKAEITGKDAQSAENNRTLMLLAIGQLQRETRGNEPFENGLKQVEAVATDSFRSDLDSLQPIAPKGAPTMTSLQKDFAAIAADISQAGRLPSDETWYGQALHRIASAVKFRRVDDLEGTDVDAVVARAEQDLANNDLDNAVAEIGKLTGPAADVASGWLTKAQTRLTVEQSIAGLLAKATTSALSAPASN